MNQKKINRKVIVEKYKKWNYIDRYGYYVWLNKYGDVIKVEDYNGNQRPVVFFDAEAIQDLQAYHGIDAEAELTAILSNSIAREIDREIIQELLRQNANT
jgi:hypothetical protein